MSGATTTSLSRSRSRVTPIRAIPSNLSTRSSPSVPPATQNYEPLLKSVLRHRLIYNIFSCSALCSWTIAVISTLWFRTSHGILGILLSPLRPSTLLFAAAYWAIGVLPVVVLRKLYLTGTRTSANSPSKTFHAALAKPSTLRALLTYTVSSISIGLIHSTLVGDPAVSVFVKSKKHPQYLNGRFVLLMFSQMTLAYTFLLRNIMLDRFTFRWPTPSSKIQTFSKWPFTTPQLVASLLTVIILSSLALPFASILFGISRSVVLPLLYQLPLLHYALRPFTAHFLRGGTWTLILPLYHISFLFRTWFLSFTTLALWELTETIFDTFISQPILVSNLTVDPTVTLISGISSSDIIFKYHAYVELKSLASDPAPAASATRTSFFADQKYTPNLWNALLREGLLLLGDDYQLFLRRGAPSTPVIPPPPAVIPPAPLPVPSTPLIKKPIYQSNSQSQSPLRNVLNSFASDGDVSRVVDTSIPELFRGVGSLVPAGHAVVPKPPVVEVKGLVNRAIGTAHDLVVERFTPQWAVEVAQGLEEWWRKERVSKVVEGCLPRKEVDALVVEVLSHLTCASLTEDRYGVVQRDIPKILEAFLGFLDAVEDYQVEINKLTSDLEASPEKEVLKVEVDKASEILSEIGDALKEGVARIVRTFGDKLQAYKFPPRTATKLQGFLDYC